MKNLITISLFFLFSIPFALSSINPSVNNAYSVGSVIQGEIFINDEARLGAPVEPITFLGGTLHWESPSVSARPFFMPTTNLGRANFDIAKGKTVTLQGNFSGNNDFRKIGAGNLIFQGDNSHLIGDILVGEGLLIGTGPNSLQSHLFLNGGAVTFAQSSPTNFTHMLQGNGPVNISGSTIIEFTGDSFDFLGDTTVTSGEFKLNAALGGNVNVNGGRISGGGTVIGNLSINDGEVTPGNSIGTLHVIGDFHQGDKTTYVVQLDQNGAHSSLDVEGKATIADNTALNVSSTTGSVRAQFPYRILSAVEGLTGTYSNLFVSNLPIIPKIIYGPNNIFLLFVQNFAPSALTHNQKAVANQLDAIVDPRPSQHVLLSGLLNLSSGNLREALDELAGTPYADEWIQAENSIQLFQRHIYGRVRPKTATNCCCRDSLWFEGSGGRTLYKKNHDASGFDVNDFELTLGIDHRFSPCLTLGSAVSYEHDKQHFNRKAHGDTETYLGSIYGLYRHRSLYLFSDLILGYRKGSIQRHVDVFGTRFSTKGNPIAFESVLYAEVGKDFCIPCLLIQPFVGIEAGYFNFKRFSENGNAAINLDIRQKSYAALHSLLGFHLTFQNMPCQISLGIDLDWRYRFTKIQNRREMSFENSGSTFDIIGVNNLRNTYEGALTLSKQFAECWNVYIQASGQHSSCFKNYSFVGGFATRW